MLDVNKLRELYDNSTQGEWIASSSQKGNGEDAWVSVSSTDYEEFAIVDALNYSYYASAPERFGMLKSGTFRNKRNNTDFIAFVHNAMPEILELLGVPKCHT